MPSPYLFPSEELFMREGVVVPSGQAEMLTNTCTQRRTSPYMKDHVTVRC